jgi:hypothetical protein
MMMMSASVFAEDFGKSIVSLADQAHRKVQTRKQLL